jgi:hypothetical protein
VIAAIVRHRLRALPWKSSNHVPDGKLRRLVALQAVVDPAESCARDHAPAGEMAGWVDEEARAYLADWKGYTAIAVQDAALVRALGPWQARTPQARRPEAAFAARLRTHAAAHGADGVLVLHAAPHCIDMTDAMLNVFIIGMPSFYSKAFSRDFSAGVYDADGALVWQRYDRLGPLDETARSRSRESVTESVESLLGPLENATPGILLQ